MLQKDVDQWHIIFYISAVIYFLGNLIFVLFGSGEIQWWNDLSSNIAGKGGKKSQEIATISTIYDTTSMTLTHHKPIEASWW